VLDHVHREELLAHGVQRRNQGDHQRRIADDEESAFGAVRRVCVAQLGKTAEADEIRQPDPDQRDEQ